MAQIHGINVNSLPGHKTHTPDMIHSSAIRKVTQPATFGSTSPETFRQRLYVEKNRQHVADYRSAAIHIPDRKPSSIKQRLQATSSPKVSPSTPSQHKTYEKPAQGTQQNAQPMTNRPTFRETNRHFDPFSR